MKSAIQGIQADFVSLTLSRVGVGGIDRKGSLCKPIVQLQHQTVAVQPPLPPFSSPLQPFSNHIESSQAQLYILCSTRPASLWAIMSQSRHQVLNFLANFSSHLAAYKAVDLSKSELINHQLTIIAAETVETDALMLIRMATALPDYPLSTLFLAALASRHYPKYILCSIVSNKVTNANCRPGQLM